MFDNATLFISKAFAADAVAPAVAPVAGQLPADGGSTLMRFAPLCLIFIVFYMLLIRPQQKKLEAQTAMLKALKKGDKVIAGGIVGVISKIDSDAFVMVEIAKDVQIKALRSSLSMLSDEVKPVSENKKN
jgi:preprotein translocase subunit YajC